MVLAICDDDAVYAEHLMKMILNSKLDEVSDLEPLPDSMSRSTYLGTTTKNVTWKAATTTAIVLGVLSVALGGLAGSLIVGAMGATAISILASQTTGGKVAYAMYRMGSTHVVTYKMLWSFTAWTGEYFGRYTSYLAG